MFRITQTFLEDALAEVVPKVQRHTSWDPHLEYLKLQTLQIDEFHYMFEQTITEEYQISTTPKTERGRQKKENSQKYQSHIMMACYWPHLHTISVVPKNISWRTNKSGMKDILTHELIHACQFTNVEGLSERRDKLIRETYGDNYYDADESENQEAKETSDALLTVIEGHATFAALGIKFVNYPDSKVMPSRSSRRITRKLMRIDPEFETIKKCYVDGFQIAKAIYTTKGQDHFKTLYTLGDQELKEELDKWRT